MTTVNSRQCAGTVLMVAPHDFEFNEETSWDNEFQNRPAVSPALINQRAMEEFTGLVDALRGVGITVLVPERRTTGARTPDAVFPNNWFGTENDGTVLLFPMAPPGRRLEKRVNAVEAVLDQNGYVIANILNIGRHYETTHFLEGTGSMVIDHDRRVVYAARSQRCSPEQLANFAHVRSYATQVFDTQSTSGKPIYHTNVMMSVGERFAVVCPDCIVDSAERTAVLTRLGADREIIEISQAQVEQSMCANILQVKNDLGRCFIVMSDRARDGFSARQRALLDQHGQIVSVPLDTIEQVGGGSARCMLAEVFLPKKPVG